MWMATASLSLKLGDQSSSDVIVQLRNRDGRPEFFYCHSSVLKEKSGFFAFRLSDDAGPGKSGHQPSCIEVYFSGVEYDHVVELLNLLYVPEDSIIDSFGSVKNALGIVQASVALGCEEITKSCIQYLEAVPWDGNEEEAILSIAPRLGPAARPILARIQPVDLNRVKDVFKSAIHFATTIDRSIPPFADELRTSAQEQVEYMLLEDEDTALIAADEDVKSEVKLRLSKIFATFEGELSSILFKFDVSPVEVEHNLLRVLSALEWMCNILPKLDMMDNFVVHWASISSNMLATMIDEKYHSGLWAVKAKLIQIAVKTLEAVGYGNVILPAPLRLELLKLWVDFIRKTKPLLDSMAMEDGTFPYRMDNDLCRSVEDAIISLVLALPSNDQATILNDWMNAGEQKFPDLSEAFEIWCYRTKSARRRLVVGLEEVSSNPTKK